MATDEMIARVEAKRKLVEECQEPRPCECYYADDEVIKCLKHNVFMHCDCGGGVAPRRINIRR